MRVAKYHRMECCKFAGGACRLRIGPIWLDFSRFDFLPFVSLSFCFCVCVCALGHRRQRRGTRETHRGCNSSNNNSPPPPSSPSLSLFLLLLLLLLLLLSLRPLARPPGPDGSGTKQWGCVAYFQLMTFLIERIKSRLSDTKSVGTLQATTTPIMGNNSNCLIAFITKLIIMATNATINFPENLQASWNGSWKIRY